MADPTVCNETHLHGVKNGFSQYPHHEYNLHHHCVQASEGERDTQKWFCSVWWFGLRTAVPVCIVWAKNWLSCFCQTVCRGAAVKLSDTFDR